MLLVTTPAAFPTRATRSHLAPPAAAVAALRLRASILWIDDLLQATR